MLIEEFRVGQLFQGNTGEMDRYRMTGTPILRLQGDREGEENEGEKQPQE
jgi:hypothetical protein